MKKNSLIAIFIIFITLIILNISAVQRFPKPEFESGYKQPVTQLQSPRGVFLEYLDLTVFIASLSVITWLVIKKRSRKGVFWLSLFSLLYFGFYRKGCICPVGSLQNVTMALFNPEYGLPVTTIAFFILPLAFTLFFGRTFCAGVCPLGTIQDVFALRPVTLKSWVQSLLGLIPFIYLGLAVLFAATGSDFIVCRYDPFVGFFRHNATFMMFAIGGILLLIGVFIARPYCRFLCPYGVLLNLVSRFSKNHMSIAPSTCINCRLCEEACPFGAIDKPTGIKYKEPTHVLAKRLILYCLITPLLVVVTGWTTSKYHETFANVNFKVRLAKEIVHSEKLKQTNTSLEATTFNSSGKSATKLYQEAAVILDRFYIGSWILGGFLGLVFGLTLARLTLIQYRNEYNTNKGTCFSCVRCVDYCPVKK
jgi:ferredoxin